MSIGMMRRGLLGDGAIIRGGIVIGSNNTGDNTEEYGFTSGSFGSITDNEWVGTAFTIIQITSRNFNNGITTIRASTDGTEYDNKDPLTLEIWSNNLSSGTLLASDTVTWDAGAGYYIESNQSGILGILSANIGNTLGFSLS